MSPGPDDHDPNDSAARFTVQYLDYHYPFAIFGPVGGAPLNHRTTPIHHDPDDIDDISFADVVTAPIYPHGDHPEHFKPGQHHHHGTDGSVLHHHHDNYTGHEHWYFDDPPDDDNGTSVHLGPADHNHDTPPVSDHPSDVRT